MSEDNTAKPTLPAGSVSLETRAAPTLPPQLVQYVNARVTVHYNNAQGYSDTGRLTYIDAVWIELTKDNRERLLIPVDSIRLMKLLEPAQREGDAGILLRPAENNDRKQLPSE